MASFRSTSRRRSSIQRTLIIAAFVWCGVVFFGIYKLSWNLKTNQVTLHLSLHPPVDIRLELFAKEAPDATRFIKETSNQKCNDCNLYRAEPVPDYWGSPDYPDTWFDGGRWGPPYALLQGQFQKGEHIRNASPENHRPIIERGMVAWAGGMGGPHFFIALADHPEWQHDHTVWAKVLDKDMLKVDLLLQRPLKKITPKRPPNLSYFVEPINFGVSLVMSSF